MTPALAWVDGRLVPTELPHLLVGDRGFLLGDGVFETFRVRRGTAIEWAAHAGRLRESAAALSIDLRLADEALRRGVAELTAALGLEDAAVRLTVSRGTSLSRGLLPPDIASLVPTVVIAAWEYAPPPAALLGRGVHALVSSIRRDPSSPLAGVKSTSRADHVYARIEAEKAALDDALFLTLDGRICETTAANVWIVTGHRLSTPGLDSGVLAGTTRGWVLETAPTLDAGVALAEEGDLWMADLLGADEAFLSSSVAGIVPLTSVEGAPIGSGQPGEVTMALRAAREGWIAEHAPADTPAE